MLEINDETSNWCEIWVLTCCTNIKYPLNGEAVISDMQAKLKQDFIICNGTNIKLIAPNEAQRVKTKLI